MANINLTSGAVSNLMSGTEVDRPVFQILGFKKIAGQGGSDRYRLNISDGNYSHTFAMLATQLNHMIPDETLDNFCVIRAEKIVSNTVSNKRVLIILELTVLAKGSEVCGKIGNPVQWTDGVATPAGGPNRPTPIPVRAHQEFPASRLSSGQNNGGMVKQEPRSAYASNNNNNSISGFGGAIVPIQDVNPYNSKNITIKARVTNKSPIKTWSNSKGEGKLFSMDLLDETGEIRMTGFKEVVDQHYDMIKVGEVYMIRNFQVKPANKQYSSLNNDYELTFNNDTILAPCADSDSNAIPVISFDFVEIANIEGIEKDRIIDIIGICKERGEVVTITSRVSNKEFTKREVILVDKTNREVNLTLWGKQAEEFLDDSNPVIAVKGCKVSDFNGKSLSCLQSSTFQINPDVPQAHILRGWYDNEGMNLAYSSLSTDARSQGRVSQWKLLREANASDNPAANDKGDYYMTKVTIMTIKRENAMYKACSATNCNKKVVDNNNGLYRCEKCNREVPDFKWRAMLNVCFADPSDFVWATCFQETAEIVLGEKAENLGVMFSENGDSFDTLVKEAVFKNYIVKFRSKMETYNNENRLKTSVIELHPLNYAEYARKLLNEVKECSA